MRFFVWHTALLSLDRAEKSIDVCGFSSSYVRTKIVGLFYASRVGVENLTTEKTMI